MERLTIPYEYGDGYRSKCAESCGECDGCWGMDEIVNRLGSYEDTKLTPAEVHSLWGEWNAMMSVLNSIGGYDRLRELAEADKEGRIVVLPCKVGDTVYKVITIQAQKPVMLETQVKTLGQAADVSQLIGKKNKVINIFLTREQAVAALKEAQNGRQKTGNPEQSKGAGMVERV